MKTKNMRKKALMSSLAMLLVAVVALGGATYAWFSANASADVTGMQLTTDKSSTLLFNKTGAANDSTDPWLPGYDFDYASARVLVPASTTAMSAFYTVVSDGGAPEGNNPLNTIASAINSASAYSTTVANENGNGYLHEAIYCKSSNGGYLQVSDITVGALADIVRVGVKVGNTSYIFSPQNGLIPSGATTAAPWGIAASGNNLSVKFGQLYGSTGYSRDEQHTAAQTVTKYVSGNGADAVNLATLTAGQATKVEIFVWLEGNSESCNDDIAGTPVESISITFHCEPIGD